MAYCNLTPASPILFTVNAAPDAESDGLDHEWQLISIPKSGAKELNKDTASLRSGATTEQPVNRLNDATLPNVRSEHDVSAANPGKKSIAMLDHISLTDPSLQFSRHRYKLQRGLFKASMLELSETLRSVVVNEGASGQWYLQFLEQRKKFLERLESLTTSEKELEMTESQPINETMVGSLSQSGLGDLYRHEIPSDILRSDSWLARSSKPGMQQCVSVALQYLDRRGDMTVLNERIAEIAEEAVIHNLQERYNGKLNQSDHGLAHYQQRLRELQGRLSAVWLECKDLEARCYANGLDPAALVECIPAQSPQAGSLPLAHQDAVMDLIPEEIFDMKRLISSWAKRMQQVECE